MAQNSPKAFYIYIYRYIYMYIYIYTYIDSMVFGPKSLQTNESLEP